MGDGRDAPMIRLTVRELRDARGWTQDDLSTRSGVARITIAKIEAQRTGGIDFAVWERLADAFDVPPVELVDFRPGEPQTPVARKTGRPKKARRPPRAAPDAKRRAAKRRRRRD